MDERRNNHFQDTANFDAVHGHCCVKIIIRVTINKWNEIITSALDLYILDEDFITEDRTENVIKKTFFSFFILSITFMSSCVNIVTRISFLKTTSTRLWEYWDHVSDFGILRIFKRVILRLLKIIHSFDYKINRPVQTASLTIWKIWISKWRNDEFVLVLHISKSFK